MTRNDRRERESPRCSNQRRRCGQLDEKRSTRARRLAMQQPAASAWRARPRMSHLGTAVSRAVHPVVVCGTFTGSPSPPSRPWRDGCFEFIGGLLFHAADRKKEANGGYEEKQPSQQRARRTRFSGVTFSWKIITGRQPPQRPPPQRPPRCDSRSGKFCG